jgi:hypothetical protein
MGRYFPMDRLLGLTDSYSPGLAKMMCRAAGTDGSYDEAEETLKIYAGVTVPASQIRRMVQHIGPDIDEWNGNRAESRCEAVPTLYASYDGTGVPMRKSETQGRKGKQPDGSSATREVKLGSVFTSQGVDEDSHPIRDPGSTTYVASFEKAEAFGSMIRQEARLRGLGKAKRVAVLGDGAHWIWNLARINFPQAKQILQEGWLLHRIGGRRSRMQNSGRQEGQAVGHVLACLWRAEHTQYPLFRDQRNV